MTGAERTERLEMRLTREERKRWTAKAKQTGETLTAWMRRMIYEGEARWENEARWEKR